jgi:hypothetical protein
MRRLLLLAALCVPATASAHFHLDQPEAAYVQSSLGDPQKTGPCGPVGEGGTPTGKVTTVMAGGTMTVTITETVTHPGHYRVAIAQDEAGLPAEPMVTAGTTQCGSAPIDPNPSLPVLADGVFKHTSAFSGPQTFEVPIPAGMNCTNCVVQVLEFMSNHPAPCYYHHCAIVNVTTDPAPTGDAGVGTPAKDDGGCNSSGSASPLVLIALLALRRRR